MENEFKVTKQTSRIMGEGQTTHRAQMTSTLKNATSLPFNVKLSKKGRVQNYTANAKKTTTHTQNSRKHKLLHNDRK